MRGKTTEIFMNIIFNIGFYFLILIVTYYTSPIHETFHYIPCKIFGLSPEISYFQVLCNRIDKRNHIEQFFYFMGPYIFYSILIVVLYILSSKYDFIKYFIPIPIFDIIFNYVSALKDSDFKSLLLNTYPNRLPFVISMILVALISILTIRAYYKYRIYSFKKLVQKFLLFLEHHMIKN